MENILVNPAKMIKGSIEIPGDKSISQRAIITGSISQGKTCIKGFLEGDDCIFAIKCFEQMGVRFEKRGSDIIVQGVEMYGLKKPSKELYFGNSGTSIRIIMGILAPQDFESTLTGDRSLLSRPMGRVVEPLRLMGADIAGSGGGNFAPIIIKGKRLYSITYRTSVASAQVKSAILLAGLYADRTTTVIEPLKSRDHTERMLSYFGADVHVEDLSISIKPIDRLIAREINVPGDISSAAFFLCAGAILEGSEIYISNVGLNPTRTGVIDILKRMGVDIEEEIKEQGYEPKGDIICKGVKNIKPFIINPDEVPSVIDELPILMVCAGFADGISVIKGASELRVKEADRIYSMQEGLEHLGIKMDIKGNDIYIQGIKTGRSCKVKSFGDHRTAMSMMVGALRADGPVVVEDTACIRKSFPGFEKLLQQVVVEK